ncbi:MAG TPA: SDR family NAD(P)-dependent oxidoreductase [Usitatibacter sp.]|jgi:benzil reductase ((S)-benzoin forming)|nr:SDR family NAD(P)-dependent oxidoreductase [Usitatibacter sp.]
MNLYIVTGTRRGLGEALARLIARGKDNELIAVSREAAGDIAGGVRFTADLSDMRAVDRVCGEIASRVRGRRFDKAVLVNNAGVVQPVAPLERTDAAELERNLAVNLVAPMLLMRGFLRATEGVAGLRRIVNISSGAGRRPISGWSAYCAAKAGLDMATRVVALEAQSRGLAIEAVSLAPGVIDTGMQEHVRGASAEDFADVARFRQMKEEGTLRSADDVAADILAAEAGGLLAGEALGDLRSLAAGAE